MTLQQTTFTTELIVTNLPEGSDVTLQTNANLTIAFWNPAAGAFGATATVDSPGKVVTCLHSKAKLALTGTASINIVIRN
jgi:hypothetical protein